VPAATSPASGARSEPAAAKVNLFLRVTGRRADGYHELESLAVFAGAGAGDVLRAAPSAALSLRITGRFAAELGPAPDNLVLRAARALATQAGREAAAALTLEKNLPVASGIGGGSADAAATLRLLTRLWRLPAPPPAAMALKLGADVPVCLRGAPCVMRGVGEILSPAPELPVFGLALVNPGMGVATPAVFQARQGGFSPPAALPAAWPDAARLARDLAALGNDLQAPALTLCPAIADVLAALRALPGCLLAQMSGSGATCFGLFATPVQAAAAARLNTQAGWWAWGGTPAAALEQGLPEPAACL
jgi:4-diphosphocytidyl-2-C-methyl-D-erythritol kinase